MDFTGKRNRGAFTFVDLTVTVLIIGILTATAAPKFARSLVRSEVDAACKRIKADLAWARQHALSKSAPQTVQFTTATSTYTLVGMADVNRPNQTYAVTLTQPPYNATIVSATFGADANVIFDHYGLPDSGGAVTVSRGGITGTVTLDANSGLASMVVNP